MQNDVSRLMTWESGWVIRCHQEMQTRIAMSYNTLLDVLLLFTWWNVSWSNLDFVVQSTLNRDVLNMAEFWGNCMFCCWCCWVWWTTLRNAQLMHWPLKCEQFGRAWPVQGFPAQKAWFSFHCEDELAGGAAVHYEPWMNREIARVALR